MIIILMNGLVISAVELGKTRDTGAIGVSYLNAADAIAIQLSAMRCILKRTVKE